MVVMKEKKYFLQLCHLPHQLFHPPSVPAVPEQAEDEDEDEDHQSCRHDHGVRVIVRHGVRLLL